MTQVDLSPESRTLIAATRSAYEPTASNRAQVRWRVERQLAARAARPAWRAWRPLAIVASSVLAAAGAAAGTALLWPEAPAPPTSQPHVTRAETTRALPRVSRELPSELVVPQPATSSASAASKRRVAPAARLSPPRTSSALAAETLLIARAQAATNRGQAGRALELLKEYDRKFANGSLSEERSAARVVALCAAGQRNAARAEADRFLARWPRSPQGARILSSPCGPGSRSAAPR